MSLSWPDVTLSEVLTERRETPNSAALALGEIPIVSKISFEPGQIELRVGTQTKTGMILVRPGDLVVSGINAAKGAVAIWPADAAGQIAATIHYGAYTPRNDRVDVRFLWWLLRSHTFRDLLLKHLPGGIKTELKAKRLLAIPVPLPPLTEQRRIVARIEAFSGSLADANRFRKQSEAACDALGRAHLSKQFERLAAAYPVRALGEVSLDISDGPHKKPSYVDAGVPFVTVKNMVSGILDLGDVQHITPEDHRVFNRRSRAEKGDVLYSKDGATRGRPCFVDTDEPFSFFVSVALIKPRRDLLDGRYLCHLLNSGGIRERMHLQSRGDMIPHIVLTEIRNFPVPLPPLEEQQRVVAYLDVLKAQVDELKNVQKQTAAALDALMPSILDKAFRGEV